MVCVLDTSNLFFITWSIFKKNQFEKNGDNYVIKEEDLGLFYHMFFNKIIPYLTSYKDSVFCFEGLHSCSWRKKIYPPYKENRAATKEDPNYKWVGPLMENCLKFLSLFHTKILKVENAEGDDCIYSACKYFAEQGEQVKIISTDKDLSQIINFYPDLVTQYNPIKQVEITANENIILEKAIVGDTSDNIKFFKGIGPKTFEKMLADKEFWNKKMTQSNQKLLDIALQIVDLRKFPQEYQNNIRTELEKPWNEFDKDGIELFMMENKLKSCYSDWSSKWCPDLELLYSSNENTEVDAMDEIMEIINS